MPETQKPRTHMIAPKRGNYFVWVSGCLGGWVGEGEIREGSPTDSEPLASAAAWSNFVAFGDSGCEATMTFWV